MSNEIVGTAAHEPKPLSLLEEFNHNQEPTNYQINILKPLRFSDAYRREYSRRMIDRDPEGKYVKAAIRTIKRVKNETVVNLDTHRELIEDLIYTRVILCFFMFEYFAYGLQNLSIEERMEFLSEKFRLPYYEKLNPKEARGVLWNKYATYQHIGQAFKREMLELTDASDRDSFVDYCRRHDRILVKPRSGSLGKGIQILSLTDYCSSDELFEKLMLDYEISSKNALVLEEPIIQHPAFAQIHPESVNSVRVFTYYDGTNVSVIFAWLKAGRGNAIVDNGGAGGVLAAIDPKTGVVFTDAADENATTYKVHPDTGFGFKGWHIEQWDEIVENVTEWAKAFPDLHVIGWDVAVSADRGVQLIEGNHQGMVNLVQIPTRSGIYREFLKKIEWDKYC